MSLTLIIVLFGLIKLPIAATMLLLPLRHDAAMQADSPSPSVDDSGGGGPRRSGGDEPRPRWPVTGGPAGPRRGARMTTPPAASRARGAHTPPIPVGPRRVRLPLRRRRTLPAAR
jgi:hypothetical protein